MNISSLSLFLCSRKVWTAISTCAVLTLVLSGCGVGTVAPAGQGLGNLSSISGTVFGGHQPIGGATVNLYAVGTSGYGRGATKLATTKTSTTGAGTFSFTQVSVQPGSLGSTYVCPSAKTEIYITVASGDPSGGDVTLTETDNSAIKLLAGIGQCGSVGSLSVNINEAQTIASVWALQQYINPVTSPDVTIGTSSSAQGLIGLQNAFAIIPLLVPYATGTPNATFASTGTNATVNALALKATPEAGKIAFMADILATCVDEFTDACTTLFNAAPPPTAARTSQPSATWNAAVDTLQVALYMATNPTNAGTQITSTSCAFKNPAASNMICLYNAPTAGGSPFATTLSTQPTDWTLGVVYFPGTSPQSPTGTICPSVTSFFLYYNFQLAIDADGDVWAASNKSGTTGANISEISPTGTPLACVGASAFGGTISGLTIDTAGNIWASDNAAAAGPIEKINPATLAMTDWGETGITPTIAGLVADGGGNIFYVTTGLGTNEFTGAATASSAANSVAVGPALQMNAGVGYYLAADPAGRIWAAERNGVTGTNLYEIYPDPTNTSGFALNGYSSASVATTVGVQAPIAVDSSNKIWFGNTAPTNNISALTPNATNGSAATVTFATTSGATPGEGGLSTPSGIAIDGAGNAWIADGAASGVVSEFDNSGNALSPSTGYVKTSSPSTLRAPAVDPSGNLWIGTTASAVSNITEIVGAAVPVVTPLSAALAAGSLATKP